MSTTDLQKRNTMLTSKSADKVDGILSMLSATLNVSLPQNELRTRIICVTKLLLIPTPRKIVAPLGTWQVRSQTERVRKSSTNRNSYILPVLDQGYC